MPQVLLPFLIPVLPYAYPVWPDWAIFKGLGNKFSYKSSPNIRNILGSFENT